MRAPLEVTEVTHGHALRFRVLFDPHGECIPIIQTKNLGKWSNALQCMYTVALAAQTL